MNRSQDYMSHYYDDMFSDSRIDEMKEASERAKVREYVTTLTTDTPRRMLPILGCILGDFVGSRFERPYPVFENLGDYELIHPDCKFTDDTVFTIGITGAFLQHDATPGGFTKYLVRWGRSYPDAGFGRSTQAWIASDDPQPYGSNRNGAAMRVAPCACFADSLDQALDYARVSAEVSHNTPEGVAGAQAIAAAAYLALNGASKDEIRDYVERQFGYDLSPDLDQLRKSWSGFSCKAEDTVPQAIICFLRSHDVESAMRAGISLCSDADTIAAMAAAIAAPYYGSLPALADCLSRLPSEILWVLVQASRVLA